MKVAKFFEIILNLNLDFFNNYKVLIFKNLKLEIIKFINF